MNEACVTARGLVKKYRAKTALDGLSLSVGRGEVYGLIGPNGAGKTTAMSIMAGLIGWDSGSCEVLGKGPRRRGSAERARVGFLPEEPVFAEKLTAREYLRFIGACMGLARPEAEAERLLAQVSLVEAADRRVGGYSRGMRQRLGLACALAGGPELLILDEPSSALDPEGRKDVTALILESKAAGKTVILSTHILSDIERVCDRIGLMRDGRLLLEGGMGEILDDGLGLTVDIRCSRPINEREAAELSRWPMAAAFSASGTDAALELRAADLDAARSALMAELGRLGLPVLSLNPRKRSLEELFLAKAGRHE
jgi:ABC-2 type transport system ATP-binding protein